MTALRAAALVSALVALLPGVARAHPGGAGAGAAFAGLEAPCGGREIKPTRVVTGSFTTAQQGSHVMIPFAVPGGTTAVRVKYCHDQPEGPLSSQARHTLDMGLYDAAPHSTVPWGPRQLRGWGGSSHPDVTVSAEGFAPYGTQEPGKTTRAYRPGPIRAGLWAVELGVAAVVGRELGDADGSVDWRVEIELSSDPAFADEPYRPARYSRAPAKSSPGWYAGDLHVHGEHSALADAPMREVFDYAFKTAGLDFITLSDYVGGAQWDEIGRLQGDYPGKLVVRSAEVITYRGHANNHASATTVDHRTGPVLRLGADGATLEPIRDAQPARRLLSDIRDAGGVTQLNHVTIFPNEVPGFALLCRGCEWNYDGEETDFSLVDAIEVATGPGGLQEAPGGLGPNPFTATAIDFYERALDTGHRIAAVGSSDSHNAGRRNNPVTQSPIGQATTVVRAPELSEAGFACAVEAGHTYVKVWGPDRPDLRLEARVGGLAGVAIFGDTVRADSVDFTARVLGAVPRNGQPYTLQIVKNGEVVAAQTLDAAEETFGFASSGPGRYGLRLVRGAGFEAISTPIWVEPAGGSRPAIVTHPCTRVAREKRRTAARRRAAYRRCVTRRVQRGTARRKARRVCGRRWMRG